MPASVQLGGAAITILLKSLPTSIEIPVCVGAGALLIGLAIALVKFVVCGERHT